MTEITQDLSRHELRERLQSTIRSEGMEGKLRAHLRSWLVGRIKNDDELPRRRFGARERAMNCLVMEYLKAMDLNLSLSVFVPEAGLSRDGWKRDDVLDVLKLNPQTLPEDDKPDLVKLIKMCATSYEINVEYDNNDERNAADKVEKLGESILMAEQQVRESARKFNRKKFLTNDERKISTVDDTMVMKKSNAEESLEKIRWKREVEIRFKRLLLQDKERFRSVELIKLRAEEREKAHAELRAVRMRLEADWEARLRKLNSREESMEQRMSRRALELEDKEYRARQKILIEMQSVRSREADLKRTAATQKQQVALERQRLIEMQEQLRKLAATRQEEDQALRRLRNKLEMERATIRKEREEFERTTVNRDLESELKLQISKCTELEKSNMKLKSDFQTLRRRCESQNAQLQNHLSTGKSLDEYTFHSSKVGTGGDSIFKKEIQRLRAMFSREQSEKSDLEEQLDESNSAREILEDENATLRKMLREAREMLISDRENYHQNDEMMMSSMSIQKRVRRWRTSRRSQQQQQQQKDSSSRPTFVVQKVIVDPPKPPSILQQAPLKSSSRQHNDDLLEAQLREEERRGREKADRLVQLEEEKRKAEDSRRRKEEEEEQERQRKKEKNEREEKARLEAERRKRENEDERKRKQEEDERKRKQEEDERKRKQEEDERKRKQEEDERREKVRIEAEKRRKQEEEEKKAKQQKEEMERLKREREVEVFMKKEDEKKEDEKKEKKEDEKNETNNSNSTTIVDPVLAEHQRRARERFEERMREQARENDSATTTDDDDNSYGSSFSAGGSFEDDDDEDTDDAGGFFKTDF